MAKINKASRENIWQVRINVNDPDCKWNINPKSTFYKIIKANNENSAVRGAANYCTRQMEHFPGVFFTYSTKDVKPYYFQVFNNFDFNEGNCGITKTKI